MTDSTALSNCFWTVDADIAAQGTGGCGGAAPHITAWRRHHEAVQLLLDRGTDIEAKTADGWTALRFAALTRQKEALVLLLAKGAFLDAPCKSEWAK